MNKETTTTFNVGDANFVQPVFNLDDPSKSLMQVWDKDPERHKDAKIIRVIEPNEADPAR